MMPWVSELSKPINEKEKMLNLRGSAPAQQNPLPPRMPTGSASSSNIQGQREELMRQYKERQDSMEEVSPLIETKIEELQNKLRNEVKRKSELEADLAYRDDLCSFMEEQAALMTKRGRLRREPLDAVAGLKDPLQQGLGSSQEDLHALVEQTRDLTSHASTLRRAQQKQKNSPRHPGICSKESRQYSRGAEINLSSMG